MAIHTTSHRDIYTDAQWADLRRAPTAAIYRVSIATLAVAADLVREYQAGDAALYNLARNKPTLSLVGELFVERLSMLHLKHMVARHCSAEQSVDLVMRAARLVHLHHPDAADSYINAVMMVARTAADAVKEISIPGHRRTIEAEGRAMYEIHEALHCRVPQQERADEGPQKDAPPWRGVLLAAYGMRGQH